LLAFSEEMASAAEEMADSAVLSECESNIPGWCKAIRMHTLASNNGIIRLERLSGKEDCRPKALNMCREVENEVELGFIEPAWRPADHKI